MRKKVLMTMIMSAMMMGAILSGCSSDSDTAESSVNSTAGETKKTDTRSDPGLSSIIDAGKLKVGCKIDVPSFGYQNPETNEYEGLEIDIAYAVAAEIFGVTPDEAKEQGLVEFQGVTAKTRGPLLDNGELDMVAATFTITDERKKSWNFSTPYMEDALGLMCLESSGYNTMTDIDNAIIGVAQGSTTKDAIEAYIKEQNLDINVEFQEFDGYPALSAALSSGNIDIFAVDRAILAGYNDDTTKILPEKFSTQEYGIATALYTTELTELVDQVITELKNSGKMEQMIQEWGIE